MIDPPAELTFPRFLFGTVPALRRNVRTEARRWAQQYREGGGFPEPATNSVPAGVAVSWKALRS